MTYPAKFRLYYPTRAAAHAYLAARGFLFLPEGWANGLWAATIDSALGGGIVVTIWLRARAAA